MYCICAALWGMMGWIGAKQKRRGSSCLLCAIFGLPEDGWCGRAAHCAVETHEYRHIQYLHAHLHTAARRTEIR